MQIATQPDKNLIPSINEHGDCSQKHTFSLSSKHNKIIACEPAHFDYWLDKPVRWIRDKQELHYTSIIQNSDWQANKQSEL